MVADEQKIPIAQSIEEYDFDLPKELIAQQPVANRSDSRLLVADRSTSTIQHTHFRDIFRFLLPGDCLVLNDTRVIPAQLVGQRTSTQGRWQGLVVDTDGTQWKMLAKTRGKIQVGESILIHDRQGKPRFKLVLTARDEVGFWYGRPMFDQSNDPSLAGCTLTEVLKQIGRVPLPHYIRGGNMVDADLNDYQTIYAKHDGAVAAPTAGLHFTTPLLQKLADRGVVIAPVTLHVGIGTFRPVTAENLDDHQMHSEIGSVSAASAEKINDCRQNGGRIIAVGTTSIRLLETAASVNREMKPWEGASDLFIRPGYQFKIVDGLITNFHLPKSTLIVLVRTFGGPKLIKQAYAEAIDEKYRFFSYGDAMLIT